MGELFSAGLFWFYVLAELFTFYMQRTSTRWQGLNQTMPAIMGIIAFVCWIALTVFIVIVFIKIRPLWYGLLMIAAGFIVPLLLTPSKTLELVVAAIGMVAGPVFVILSFLKIFAVI